MTEISTHTLSRPGVALTYDVRRPAEGSGGNRTLLVVGSPMAASGFPTFVGNLTDRTVVTYDPRGTERSLRTEEGTVTPHDHAGDLAAVIEVVGEGAVDLFATSGGAVNALALVASRPELVATLVAHEPPLCRLVPDAEFALASVERIRDAYQTKGFGSGMAGFIALVMHKGELTAADLDAPLPDPAMFGMPTDDDGNRNDPLLGQNLLTCTGFEPAIDKLSAVSTRIVVAVGEDSEGELARRGGEALADLLVIEPVVFPGGHNGFQGDEYGMPGKPEEFAAKLREVLA